MPTDGAARVLDLTEIVAGLREALGECSLESTESDLPKRKNILTLASAVSDAGIDGEALVRYGCAYDVAVSLAIALAVDAIHGPSPQGRQWSRALGIGTALALPCAPRANDIAQCFARLVSHVLPVLLRWVYNAPLSDIVTLSPPAPDVGRAIAEAPDPPDEVCDQYRWIADRLGGQPLTQWATKSITAEYRWRRGRKAANLPPAVLADIPVETEVLAVALADRHLLHGQPISSIPPVAHQVDERATTFLHARRYSDAAALFEFMGETKMLPEVQCLNNRGFCWIPQEPERALHFLQRAASSGYTPVSVNVYNQMCCMVELGDAPGVRALSERYWLEQFESDPVSAKLWVRDGTESVLKKTADARELVAQLALENARREGWPDRVTRWQMRLDALVNGEYAI